MKVSEYDHEASISDPGHISHLLRSNIGNIKAEIEKEGEKLLREKTPALMSDPYVKKYQEYVATLYSLALNSCPEEKRCRCDLYGLQEPGERIKHKNAIHDLRLDRFAI